MAAHKAKCVQERGCQVSVMEDAQAVVKLDSILYLAQWGPM